MRIGIAPGIGDEEGFSLGRTVKGVLVPKWLSVSAAPTMAITEPFVPGMTVELVDSAIPAKV